MGIFQLNSKDFLRGLIMAVVVPVLVLIQNSVSAGTLTFDWKQLAIAAVSGFVAYLLKNFLTDDIKAAQKTIEQAKEKGKI